MRCARVFAVLSAVALFAQCGARSPRKLVVGSKNFTEQVVLAEIVAQYAEQRLGISVERRHHLGGTLIAHQAVVAGEIDLYVEYTGTALTAVLNQPASVDPAQVLGAVRRAYAERFKLTVAEPLGFNNTFAIVVRGEDAKNYNLRAISDLARAGRTWRAGFGYEFKERADGLVGFTNAYDTPFSETRFMELGLLYRALQENQVDVVAGSATDGVISSLGMVVLQDDRRYFPPYEAVPIVNGKALERIPELAGMLSALAGKISEEEMRRMNHAVDGEGRDAAQVAREFLKRL